MERRENVECGHGRGCPGNGRGGCDGIPDREKVKHGGFREYGESRGSGIDGNTISGAGIAGKVGWCGYSESERFGRYTSKSTGARNFNFVG